MSFRTHQAVTILGEPCWFPVVSLILLYRTKIVAFCLNGCAIYIRERGNVLSPMLLPGVYMDISFMAAGIDEVTSH